jgi:hypothetical protein
MSARLLRGLTRKRRTYVHDTHSSEHAYWTVVMLTVAAIEWQLRLLSNVAKAVIIVAELTEPSDTENILQNYNSPKAISYHIIISLYTNYLPKCNN